MKNKIIGYLLMVPFIALIGFYLFILCCFNIMYWLALICAVIIIVGSAAMFIKGLNIIDK